MIIPFDTFFQRVSRNTDIATQMDLARALGVNRSAITQAKNRNAVPQKWVLALSRMYGLSPDWLEFGTGTPKELSSASARVLSLPETQMETIMMPKVKAILCAGSGSFELEPFRFPSILCRARGFPGLATPIPWCLWMSSGTVWSRAYGMAIWCWWINPLRTLLRSPYWL
jgi:plasmid maintenance system antidote protein VapI